MTDRKGKKYSFVSVNTNHLKEQGDGSIHSIDEDTLLVIHKAPGWDRLSYDIINTLEGLTAGQPMIFRLSYEEPDHEASGHCPAHVS